MCYFPRVDVVLSDQLKFCWVFNFRVEFDNCLSFFLLFLFSEKLAEVSSLPLLLRKSKFVGLYLLKPFYLRWFVRHVANILKKTSHFSFSTNAQWLISKGWHEILPPCIQQWIYCYYFLCKLFLDRDTPYFTVNLTITPRLQPPTRL